MGGVFLMTDADVSEVVVASRGGVVCRPLWIRCEGGCRVLGRMKR